MRDVLLKDRDVRELSERVKELSFSINVEFPPRISEGNVRKLFVEDIEKFKENNNIIVHPSGDEPDFPEGIDIEIDLDEPINGKSKAHLIIINDAVLHLPDGALSRGLKETLLHEFSHLILKHPGVLIPPDEYDSPDVLSTMMWNYAQFLHNEKVRNFDAELMALVLGFWPAAEFTRLFKANRASMREIANAYKMTVESALQWTVLLFHDVLDVHYMKRVVGDSGFSDCYGCVGDGIDPFEFEGTAAYKALHTQLDSATKDNPFMSNYECRAYYEKKDFFVDYQSDVVLVIGFKKSSLDAFVLPVNRPEVQPYVDESNRIVV